MKTMTVVDLRWQSFLQDAGVRAKLTVGEMEVWQFQFDRSRERWTVAEIKQALQQEKNTGKDSYKGIIRSVYNRLEDLGVSFENDNDKAVKVWEWLRSEFPSWDEARYGRSKLSKAELWDQLKELGNYAPDRLGMFTAQAQDAVGADIGRMNALPPEYRQPSPFLAEIPRGTAGLKFRVTTDQGLRRVLLLNRDESGVVVCMCPSPFVQSAFVQGGELVVPDARSGYAYLGADTPGKEEWWAWLVPQMPSLSWLQDIVGVLELQSLQLADLLSSVEITEGEVLHTFYQVK
jgi:hypothetical protein